MQQKALAGIVAFILFAVSAFGVASASPNQQASTEVDPFEFLFATLKDANDKGVLSATFVELLSNTVIENLIAPGTGETSQRIRERLSVEGQSSFQFLIVVITDASDKDVLSDSLSELLSDWLIENLIAPHTGETPEQVRARLISRMPADDRAALVALYNATDGPNWSTSTNWLSDKPLETWYGVKVTGGQVTGLHLNRNGLRGRIPSEIGNLLHLRELRFGQDNDLIGELPSELSRLKKLEVLDLGYSEMSGVIPAWLGDLSRLRLLWLDGNRFIGEVPKELGNLTRLDVLTFHDNPGLIGQLPESLMNIPNLWHLTFDGTGLCSPVDDEFQKWLLNISNWRGSNCSSESPTQTTSEDGVTVRDKFGRVVNETGIVLVDWEGHIANPAMRYFIELPHEIPFPARVVLSSSESRMYFDLPSYTGMDGPTKVMELANSSSEGGFYISIFPDRDKSDEKHSLAIQYMDGQGLTRAQTIDVHVIDQDIGRSLEFNIIADFSHDETGMFDNPAARETIQQVADDFAYFIGDMDLDEVPAGEEQMWIWDPGGYDSGRFVANSFAYTGTLISVYGHPHDGITPSGGPTPGGRNHSSNGVEYPIKRSGSLHFDPRGVWKPLGYVIASPESDWWKANQGGVFDLYGTAIHEMGHTLVFMGSGQLDGFAEFYDTGEIRDPAVVAYNGSAPVVDIYAHLPGTIDAASRRGAYGNEYGGETPYGREILTKLHLLVAQAVGYVLRDTSPFRELSLSDEPLAGGSVGTSYTHTMNVVGGIPAYYWTIESGALPNGLSLDSFTGTISGAPQESGTFEFTIRVRDNTEGDSGVARAATLNVGN